MNPLPQLQVTAELALLVIKLLMRRVGLLLGLHRAVAHVLHAQRRGDHQHLVERFAASGLQNHAAHARVEWQLGQLLPHGGEFIGVINRTELVEQLVAIGNGAT